MLYLVREWLFQLSPCRDEDGQDLVEYALLCGLLSIIAVTIIVLVGPQIATSFQCVVNQLKTA